jgi:hypothetical protein
VITVEQITAGIAEVQAVGDQILVTIEGLAPGVALEAGTAETVLNLLAQLVTKAITAFSAAANTPITPESIAALMPDSTPLSAPDSV